MNNGIEARMVYDNAKDAINRAFPEIPNAANRFKLTMSDLRFEQAVVAGQTLYTFPILQTDTSLGIFNTELRLKLQDSFVISQIAYYIGLPASGTDTAWEPDTYPNPFRYGANAVPMKSLYNGNIKLTINNDVTIYNWHLMRHWYSPETQQTAAAAAGSPIDQKRLCVDSFTPMEPTITLIGSKDNLLQIFLNAAPASFSAGTRMIIWVRGVNAQNSTVVS
ncbi:MAG: hypothetical protein V4721_12435 [Bacteroidota bacterium]